MTADETGTKGRILVADDEETFLNATADLLRREGYLCDTATNASTAAELLEKNVYDLLIADIKMPGNPNLELIQKMPMIAEGMPVILMTGYPSVDSAIRSLNLPVSAYLVKPLDFEELLEHVQRAIGRHHLFLTMRRVQDRLKHWQTDLQNTEHVMLQEAGQTSAVPLDLFLDLTLANIVASLGDLRSLIEGLHKEEGSAGVCHLLGCPRPASFLKTLHEVIEVLKKTKSAFKSKELGELRQKLESLAQKME